jgi:hypothetical protein
MIIIYVFRQIQQCFIVQLTGNNFRSLDHPLQKLSTFYNFQIRTVHLGIIKLLFIHKMSYLKKQY